MKLPYHASTLSIVSLLFPLASALHAGAVSAPYSNDFSSSVTDFTETADANWSLSGETYQYFTSIQNNAGTAMVTANAFGSTYADFVVSTTFTVTALGSGTSNWGFALLGNSENPSNFILVDYSSSKLLRVLSLGGAGNGSAVDSSKTSLSFVTNQTYTLTATGSYVGTSLSIKVDLSNGSTTDSITSSAFDTLATGYNGSAMGLRARSGSGGGTTVKYDNFSIATVSAVPEPGSYALLAGISMLGFLAIRRRR